MTDTKQQTAGAFTLTPHEYDKTMAGITPHADLFQRM